MKDPNPGSQLHPQDHPQEQNALVHRLHVPSCYQCKRCTNGCPVTAFMDLYPDQVIRLANLDQMDRVLTCSTIWICSSCETCTTRCPNEVDIAGVMDHLKELALQQGIKPPQPRTLAFHQAFLSDIEKRGRIFEGRMMQSYMIKSGDGFRKLKDLSIIEDMKLGWKMFQKGRMPLLPEGIKAKDEIRKFIREGR